MPIPASNEHGYLPPGIHRATMEEVEDRFGRETEVRHAAMESLRWLVDASKRAGILRVVINGSFVTDVIEPNDVDCALLSSSRLLKNSDAWAELDEGFPYIEMQVLESPEFEEFIDRTYASDRDYIAKGMVELIL